MRVQDSSFKDSFAGKIFKILKFLYILRSLCVLRKIIYKSISISISIFSLLLLVSVSFLIPSKLYAESEKIWVDTSHWEVKEYWVESGYWETTLKRRWVDTSYTVSQGYWENNTEKVWVSSGHYDYYNKSVWTDTSHWETRYSYVDKWVPINLIIYVGTDSYGWAVYSGFAKSQNPVTIVYNENKYHAKKWVIDYQPGRGGRVYAIKYQCYEVLSNVQEAYKAWVESGYWKTIKVSYWVDMSHWETVLGGRWIDTSYTASQGYWEYYTGKEWISTGHYEYKIVWVEDGFYAASLHGELIVEKDPKYIFTKWHKDKNNDECSMNLDISWKVDTSNLSEGEEEKKIVRLYIYEDVFRFDDKGIEKVIIFDKNVPPSVEGNINTITKFEYSGSEESLLHIYLFAQSGESAHIYFSNPVNGFRSINLMPEGSGTDANIWLGGISHERFEF